MNVPEEIRRLASALPDGEGGVRTELTTFESGAVMLDVHYQKRLIVLAWIPSEKMFGVDDCEDEAFTSSYRYGFADLPSAWAKLLELLRLPEGRSHVPTSSLSVRS